MTDTSYVIIFDDNNSTKKLCFLIPCPHILRTRYRKDTKIDIDLPL